MPLREVLWSPWSPCSMSSRPLTAWPVLVNCSRTALLLRAYMWPHAFTCHVVCKHEANTEHEAFITMCTCNPVQYVATHSSISKGRKRAIAALKGSFSRFSRYSSLARMRINRWP
jgi:hypothetical protein